MADKDTVLAQAVRDLIDANHILHYHDVVDAYGHVSMRHPNKPDVMLLARHFAPATISGPQDIVEYYIEDSQPVNKDSPGGYIERTIHSELYKAYPEVKAVLHSHASSIIPFGISKIPLKPCYHMAGFLGEKTPVYDMRNVWKQGEVRDLLVRTLDHGAQLAQLFKPTKSGASPRAVVLMRSHGMTVCADDLRVVVSRGVYTMKNAAIQTAALTTQAALGGGSADQLTYLDADECESTAKMIGDSVYRPWGLWKREVSATGLYVNTA